jgi:hydroxymethylpyrimidine/phosphomethylpyrimidine kinase
VSDPDRAATFTSDAWDRIAGWRDAVETMPFIRALADGSLPADAFTFYLGQDAAYLIEFARVLSAASVLAPGLAAQRFFAGSAHTALEVESSLHRDWLTVHPVDDGGGASPTTVAYTDHLLAAAARGNYPVLVAAVLPCYWLYAHIGSVLLRQAGDLTDHPYARWISTYADPGFQDATRLACGFADDAASTADPATYTRMIAAFERSAMHEYLFFRQGLEPIRWPVAPAGSAGMDVEPLTDNAIVGEQIASR